MRPPRETVTVILPRPLVYGIRARYDPAVADDLFRMLGCAQMEQSFRRMAGWPSMGLGWLLLGSVVGMVRPASPMGLLAIALCCGAIARFAYQATRYAQWRLGIWNRDPQRWTDIADTLEPIEQECLRRGDPKETLHLRL